MESPRKTPRMASMAGMAAFGILSLGAVSVAGAHPTTVEAAPVVAPASIYGDGAFLDDGFGSYWGDDGVETTPVNYDLDGDGVLEHVEIDYRHYDRDQNGALGPTERTAYWGHMLDMGMVGGESFAPSEKARLARLIYIFDRDGDGRLDPNERLAVSRLIQARQIFLSLDRNRDNNLTSREARLTLLRRGNRYYAKTAPVSNQYGFFYWNRIVRPAPYRPTNWIAARFRILDSNDNGRVSWGEVESHLIKAYRRGENP